MRGRTLVPRSTLPPWLSGTDAFASTVELSDDLIALGRTAIIGHCQINLAFDAGEVVNWFDALGVGINLQRTALGRGPTVDPTTKGLVFDGVADRMTSNADPALDIAPGGSLITLASKTAAANRGIAALFNPDGTKSQRVTTDGSNIYVGQVTDPTNRLTAGAGGTVAGAIPRMIDVGYTGGAPINITVSDSDSRVQSGTTAVIPAGEAYQLELYHTRNANQSGGIIYAWLWVTPEIDATCRALIRAWGAQNFPAVQFV